MEFMDLHDDVYITYTHPLGIKVLSCKNHRGFIKLRGVWSKSKFMDIYKSRLNGMGVVSDRFLDNIMSLIVKVFKSFATLDRAKTNQNGMLLSSGG